MNHHHSPVARKTTQLRPKDVTTLPDYALKIDACPPLVDPRAIRSCLALMDQAAVNGGSACHWGGPSALAELLSALYANVYQLKTTSGNWDEQLNLVNDIGHAHNAFYALYALYKLISYQELNGFRSMNSKLTGHGEGHLFPEGVLLSNGPLGSTIPQAQGLALGDKLNKNLRKTLCFVSDGAMMEGEVKEALAAIPGMFSKNILNPFILVISDNNTKLSGRIEKDSFSMQPTFDSLSPLGWETIKLDGHNLAACSQLFQELLSRPLESFKKPIAIIAKTIKGYGIKSTAESSSGGHGYPLKAYDENLLSFLKELWQGAEVPAFFQTWAQELIKKPATDSASKSASANPTPTDKVQAGFGKAAVASKQKGIPVLSVTSDLPGSTGIAPFIKSFPEASFDVGIAESNMVSVATGLSKVGFVPIVDTFAAFGVTKGNLPLIMSSLSNAPIIALYTHTGFQDAADGASHQSLTYASALGSIPGVDLVAPATSKEAEELLTLAIERQNQSWEKNISCPSTIFFAGRENFPVEVTYTATSPSRAWGLPRTLIQGNGPTVLISYGPLVHECLKAAEVLKNATVINHLFLNHFDASFYVDFFKSSHSQGQKKWNIIFVEDHQKIGGVGSWFFSKLWETLSNASDVHTTIHQVAHLAVQGEFGQSAYTAQELYAHHGLNAQAIVKQAKQMLT
ncbi:MAG: transketolase C-terminal domain-containing protein [Bacteriovoracaceae bacterium]|nr:transketolase C-terminal domain-containing protein [Bacteriovoracaceae bacterium]